MALPLFLPVSGLQYGPPWPFQLAGDLAASYGKTGALVGRILKGEKPSDLVMRPTKFELIINLNAAKVLGIEGGADTSMQLLADEVIE